MSTIEELKAEIERLPGDERAELARWLSERQWERWDTLIKADSRAGSLDFLIDEARSEKSARSLKKLKHPSQIVTSATASNGWSYAVLLDT